MSNGRPRHHSRDVLSVVDAAYSVDVPYSDWALGLLRTVDRVIVGGFYGVVCTYRHDGENLQFDDKSVMSLGAPPDLLGMSPERPVIWISRSRSA